MDGPDGDLLPRRCAGESGLDVSDAGATAGAGPACIADLLDGGGAIVDGGIDISGRGGVAEADVHGVGTS